MLCTVSLFEFIFAVFAPVFEFKLILEPHNSLSIDHENDNYVKLSKWGIIPDNVTSPFKIIVRKSRFLKSSDGMCAESIDTSNCD